MLSTSRLKGIKSKWNRNHHTAHGSAWIKKKTANSLIYCMLHQKQRMTSEIKVHLLGWSGNLCEGGALIKNRQKRSKWKDLCSGMPKRDSCSRNQLFHLEILSLPWTPLFYFMWIISRLFRTYSGFTAWWEHFTVGSCVMQIRPEYTPWDMSVLLIVNSLL